MTFEAPNARTRQYLTADKLKDRIALHEQFGDDQEDFHAWQFRQVQAPKDARVLEVGCGSGRLWLVNSGRIPPGWELTLSDLSEGMLRESETNLMRVGTRAIYRQHPATDLPYDDDSFDVMFANHMLYHVPDVPLALSEARRVLKPGGRFYAATNGSQHMEEAVAVLEQLTEKIPELDGRRTDITPFSLETGEELLLAQFGDVRLFERRDQLLVTEAEPLIRYALSLIDQPLEDVLGPLDGLGDATPEQQDARVRFEEWRKDIEARFVSDAVIVKRMSGFFEAL
ncbi:MAG TPA: class I SAM-dependent methyltransferase [Trueperaceae bacterium]|nr:class I SAM-dependent methyltransferase [Trueperaceae bacterium]